MPLPTLADFSRDNTVDQSVEPWRTAVKAALPTIEYHRVDPNKKTGIPPLDVVLGRHPHARPWSRTAYIDPWSINEETLHIIDRGSDEPLSDNPAFREAVRKGTDRMREAYTKPVMRDGKLIDVISLLPPSGRMRQLATEVRPRVTQPWFTAHGRAYRLMNQFMDWPNFDADAAGIIEAVPALAEMPRDSADKYYPEAMQLFDEFFDKVPVELEKYRRAKAVPHLRDVSTPK